MKLAAAIILYNPKTDWISNVMTYIDYVEHLYIFDNSLDAQNNIPEIIYCKSTYYHSGDNQGIAKRLNAACNIAKYEGYRYLLTMDQDSSFQVDEIQKYVLAVASHESNKNTVAYGTNVSGNKKKYTKKDRTIITSGMIIHLEVFQKIGSFDEKLFIDYVDIELCLRAWKQGYQILKYDEVKMNHKLGEEKFVLTPMLKRQNRAFHQPIRIYYIVRNFIYIRKLYPEYKAYIPYSTVLNEVKNGLFYNRQKSAYIFFIYLAIKDYFKGKTGKLEK